jgi:two-component system sensor histidine kinase GlrK
MRKSLRATSVLQLALIAYALAGVPLIAALVTATLAVDRLATRSQQSVLEAVQTIDAGRVLVASLLAMERNARQFQLLGDSELFEGYLSRRENFLRSIDVLRRGTFSREYAQAIGGLHAEEEALYEVLNSRSRGSEEVSEAIARFPALRDAARDIFADSSRGISREVEQLRQQAAHTQRLLFWQAMAVIPAAMILAVLGTLLIARPIRQIDHAIRRLGGGQFDMPVQVHGPRDLEELGDRLEWLRKRLLDLDAQKIRFLRHISHELKTPLTAIREGAQLLSDEVAGQLAPAQEEIAQIMCRSSVQLQRRIEDLLNFNTIVQGLGVPVRLEPVEVVPLVEQVLGDQLVHMKARQIEIDRDVQPVSVLGNREQLRIVLDNLLSNAIKYSPPGGHIQLRLKQGEMQAVIEVCDEGPGIRPDERDKVFQPFYQGSAEHDGHIRGTGLGLAIAQEYVRAHRGTIEVVEIPRGACLRVLLPLADAGGAEELSTAP